MSDTVLIESHYFPSIAYFSLLRQGRQAVIDTHESFVKQSYRNRCYILGANKVQMLSVPVKKWSQQTPTQEIRINYEQPWQPQHWRSIASAYGNAPFFDFFAATFHDILYRQYTFLVELNTAILTKCLEILQWSTASLTFSTNPSSIPAKPLQDYRGALLGRSERFPKGLFLPRPYRQVFGKDFVPNLSVIDLLFCEGLRANAVINHSGIPQQ